MGKSGDYNLLCLPFVDYQKAFDSIGIPAMLTALQNQNTDPGDINIIKHIYENSSSVIRLRKASDVFPIERGLRQGDAILPKLITVTLG